MSKSRKPTALADLDIVEEAKAQPDGLAERLKRARAPAPQAPPEKARNSWRQGKALIQIAIPEDVHIELSILAKRRRMPLTRLVTDALNGWLEAHGHTLRIP